MTKRLIANALLLGFLLNLTGWLGNVFLLGDEWDQVNELATPAFSPPWSPLLAEIATVVSDFVFAFVLVWVFSRSSQQTIAFALKLVVAMWLAAVVMTYLALVNAGFLPISIAWKTSLLALVTFVLASPLLWVLARDR